MSTRTITKIKPTTLGNTAALFYLVIGLTAALFIGLSTNKGIPFCIGYTFGYTLCGYLSGLIGAVLYNFVVKYTGGVQVEVSE